MDTNRISASISAQDQQVVMAAIADIRQKLPFLIDLTKTDRVGIPKLGDKSQAFVKKAVDIGTQHPDIFPSGFLDEMRKDARLFEALSPIRLAIDQLQKQVDDTVMQVGAEVFAAARTVYTVTKTPFAEAKLRTAADDLGKRFGRKSKSPAPSEPASSATPQPAPVTSQPTPTTNNA